MSQKYNAGPVRGTGLSLSYAVVQHGPNVRAAHGDDDGVRLRLLDHDRPAAGVGVPGSRRGHLGPAGADDDQMSPPSLAEPLPGAVLAPDRRDGRVRVVFPS